MTKILNFSCILLIIIFFIFKFKYYSSSKNIEEKNFTRNNINEIINKKISNLPVLENDTNNVIEFNDGYSNENKNSKSRNFWNLLKTE